MAVHPLDPDIVIIGTQADGVFVTRDGGESAIKTNVPADATEITGIVFSSDAAC
jgi:hypothetical protein